MKTTKQEYAKAIEENNTLIESLKKLGKSTVYPNKKEAVINMMIEATNVRAVLISAATKDYPEVNWLYMAIPDIKYVNGYAERKNKKVKLDNINPN